jgi:hypothetical protein
MGYVNNFYVRGVSMCEEWVFLVLGDEPIREDYKKNTKEESQSYTAKLIKMDPTPSPQF